MGNRFTRGFFASVTAASCLAFAGTSAVAVQIPTPENPCIITTDPQVAQPQNCDHPHPVDPVMIAREMNLTVSEIADSAQMRVTARISTHPEMFGTVGETVTFTVDGVERTAVVDSNFEAGVVFTPKPGGGMITASLPMHVEEGGLTYVSDAHAEIHYAADDVDEPPMSGGVGSMFQAIIAWFRSLFAGSS